MQQRSLFEPTPEPRTPKPVPPYIVGSATSKAAAEAIKPSVNQLQTLVLDFIVGRGEEGATDEEISVALDLRGDTARPRRRELQQKGLIVGSERRRKSQSGRNMTVWTAATLRKKERA